MSYEFSNKIESGAAVFNRAVDYKAICGATVDLSQDGLDFSGVNVPLKDIIDGTVSADLGIPAAEQKKVLDHLVNSFA